MISVMHVLTPGTANITYALHDCSNYPAVINSTHLQKTLTKLNDLHTLQKQILSVLKCPYYAIFKVANIVSWVS